MNPPPPPPPSLPTVLSSLATLLRQSSAAIHSLPTPIPTAAAVLLPCPFNPNHRLPPSSLFSHYLTCPSPLSLPHHFHYPTTLRSSATATTFNNNHHLFVSLDNHSDYIAPANHFFYRNCPGPVSVPSVLPPPPLNLPRVLYTQCADFDEPRESIGFSVGFVRFLPSEIWAIRAEMEAWGGGFPSAYSCRILRAILRLRDCELSNLCEWVVANSPRYGVIVDFAMRDHVVLLVRLCLKVVVREAFGLGGVLFSDCGGTEGNVGVRDGSFECPVLVEVMAWLALQFGVLYGEVKGKYFAVDVLKECVLDSASRASLFPLERKEAELDAGEKIDGKVENEPVQNVVPMDGEERDERKNIKIETVGSSVIFISQVAAAVAALHERFLIEEKIKALRNSRPLSAYQRYMEHAHVSKIADEERQKRPDYIPIIEHDGFLWQRSSNQEGNRVKTKEELLAEERDYKRRRMSYRGKKSNRNTLEVMRDIIEEYMKEITQAGGIGGTSNAADKKTEGLASENLNTHASRRDSEIPAENREVSVDSKKELNSHRGSEDFEHDIQRPRRDSRWDHGHQDLNSNVERIKDDRDDYSGMRNGRQSRSRSGQNEIENQELVEDIEEDYSRRSHQRRSESRERKYHKRKRDEHERNNHKKHRDEHDGTSRKRERYEDGGRRRSRTDTDRREREEDDGGDRDRWKIKTSRKSSSCHELHKFDDRYDPVESHDSYEEDF